MVDLTRLCPLGSYLPLKEKTGTENMTCSHTISGKRDTLGFGF